MDNQEKLTPERKEELRTVVKNMEETSSLFYRLAQRVGNHGFIEFTGLMTEYIKVCEHAIEKDIDFTMANTHSGVALPFEPYHKAYLMEKLDCIYGPSFPELFGYQSAPRPKAPSQT